MPEQEHTDLTVKAEIDLYYDLYVPDGAKSAPLLIAVHGYGAHKRYMMREARLVAPDNFVTASIQAPHPHYRPMEDGGYRTGYGWLSSENPEPHIRLHHKFVLDVIDKLAGDGLIDREQVFMFGFSQACALNFRFAFTYPDVLRGIIGVCGGIPGDLDTNAIYKPFSAETFYLYGDDDEFYTQEQLAGFNEKLAALLPKYRSKHYEAKHEMTQDMRKDIGQFLANRP
jgi:predicted esterase